MQNFLPSVNIYASKMTRIADLLVLIAVGGPEDNACGTNGEKRAIVDDAPLLRRELHIVDEGARIAVVVLESIAQIAAFVSRHGDGAVVQIYAGVYGLEGAIGRIALLVAANYIVAHPQGNHLFVMEYVFYYDD